MFKEMCSSVFELNHKISIPDRMKMALPVRKTPIAEICFK
jgi:hypothetical protein